jgi:hypothetical protein
MQWLGLQRMEQYAHRDRAAGANDTAHCQRADYGR